MFTCFSDITCKQQTKNKKDGDERCWWRRRWRQQRRRISRTSLTHFTASLGTIGAATVSDWYDILHALRVSATAAARQRRRSTSVIRSLRVRSHQRQLASCQSRMGAESCEKVGTEWAHNTDGKRIESPKVQCTQYSDYRHAYGRSSLIITRGLSVDVSISSQQRVWESDFLHLGYTCYLVPPPGAHKYRILCEKLDENQNLHKFNPSPTWICPGSNMIVFN